MRHYAGIGSKETPPDIIDDMTGFAWVLQSVNYVLRSGAAPGADEAFEKGSGDLKEIFIPWKNFQRSTSSLFIQLPEAAEIAKTVHKRFDQLSDGGKKLITRNVHQILGQDLKTPVEFVICWTKDGCTREKDYSVSKLVELV